MSDTPDVRQRLAAWLQTALVAQRGEAVRGVELAAFEAMPGGQSSHMMLLDAHWREGGVAREEKFVLRLEPRGNQLFLKPDAVREFRVLQGVERHGGVPVPHMLAAEPDASLLGAPYFVMSHVRGKVPLAKPSIHLNGVLPTLTVEQRTRLWTSAMKTVAAVHALDWRREHRFMAGPEPPNGYLKSYLDTVLQWYDWTTKGRAFPITDAALNYLKSNFETLDQGAPVLVWNDARIGNMIFDDTWNVAAAIDWEGATIGPAGIDLGYWIMMDEFHTEAIGVPRLPGWPDRAETIAHYEALSGRRIANVDYFVILAALYIATTLIRRADLDVASGKLSPATRLGHDNTVTQMLARHLDMPVPPLSSDYVGYRQIPAELVARVGAGVS